MNDSSSLAAAPPPAEPRDGVLAARDVTVRFGGLTALDEVSLTAQPRQVTGIIGPNGAGKTTLLNVLCGFVRPGSGELSLGTTRLTGLPPNRLASLGIARTLQGLGLFRGLTVLENVMTGATCQASTGFWAALLGLSRAGRDERALRTRALVAEPRVLLLDEPASGLSEAELPELGDLITDLADQATVVVVEHRMDLMMSVCQAIAVLDFGRLIAHGTPEQVQADPAVTDAYLGAEDTEASEAPAAGDGEAADWAAPAGDGEAADD